MTEHEKALAAAFDDVEAAKDETLDVIAGLAGVRRGSPGRRDLTDDELRRRVESVAYASVNPGSRASIEASVLSLGGVRRVVVVSTDMPGHFVVVCLGGDRAAVSDAIRGQQAAGSAFDLEHWPVEFEWPEIPVPWWRRAWRWVVQRVKGAA